MSVLIATLVGVAGLWYSNNQVRQGLAFTKEDLSLTKEGQITDRYTAAVENLGDDAPDVRLGGIYALQRIMQDSPRDHPSIANVLSTYIRTHASKPLKKGEAPAADVEAALNVLAYRDSDKDDYFDLRLPKVQLNGYELGLANVGGWAADLSEADLTGSNLSHATLVEVNLSSAYMPGVNLSHSTLAQVNLSHASMHGADLRDVVMTESTLVGAVLEEADLRGADLRDNRIVGVKFGMADLRNADLRNVRLHSDLTSADLRGADLRDADLRRASLWAADLRGADLRGADLRGANLRDANLDGAKLDNALGLSPETVSGKGPNN
ncbi:pentapeptide repeat-containing protein [Streptomyces salinarius]|uniref:pentapeptide repeat-containing protein n=1 Tax=Streptomyces salinarius TaxID=2762598 RepID=UPI0028524D2C|nr:pentapeptide repeat-containing protein [Streptomyces salinarius]